MTGAHAEDPLTAFDSVRPRLFGIAYRMTGSVAEAEDLCQEAWLRWSTIDRRTVESPEGYLVSIVTRLAIDRSRSARVRRESYVGPSLPEPIVGPPAEDPASWAETADSLTFAFLVMLDELGPLERAAFLLREVFGYDYPTLAATLGRSETACRQLVSRAGRKVSDHRENTVRAALDEERTVLDRLVSAIARADVEGVMRLLAPDVVHLSDGGPHRRAARRPVVGPDRVARLLVSLAGRMSPDTTVEVVQVNGHAGLAMGTGGRVEMVLAIDADADGLIRHLFAQLNPDKLTHLTR